MRLPRIFTVSAILFLLTVPFGAVQAKDIQRASSSVHVGVHHGYNPHYRYYHYGPYYGPYHYSPYYRGHYRHYHRDRHYEVDPALTFFGIMLPLIIESQRDRDDSHKHNYKHKHYHKK